MTNHRRRSGSQASWLIGREPELAALLGRLHPGGAVFVCGAAGVGKTALVRAAARTDRDDIAYVAHGRTCARASAGIAAAVASRGSKRKRSLAPLLRMGARARADLVARRLRGRPLRAIIFDHVDHPCDHIPELLSYWRERTSVVVVARWDATLGCAWRSVRDGTRVELGGFTAAQVRQLVKSRAAALSLPPLDDDDVETVVHLTHGKPRLIVTTLQLAARSSRARPPIGQLVQRARLLIAARERGAASRARRRALRAVRYANSRRFE